MCDLDENHNSLHLIKKNP